MIKIKINYDDNFIKNFSIKGHANYDTMGKDIVCASVSSIAISSINLALRFDKDSLKVVEKEGLLDVEVLKKDKIINEIFLNMEDMFKELSLDYTKYVKII